jgi:hypothetical protein
MIVEVLELHTTAIAKLDDNEIMAREEVVELREALKPSGYDGVGGTVKRSFLIGSTDLVKKL